MDWQEDLRRLQEEDARRRARRRLAEIRAHGDIGTTDVTDKPLSGVLGLALPGVTEKGLARDKAEVADLGYGWAVGGLEKLGVVPEGTRAELRAAREKADEEYMLAHPEGGIGRAYGEGLRQGVAGLIGPQAVTAPLAGAATAAIPRVLGASTGVARAIGAVGGALEGAGQQALDTIDLHGTERARPILLGAALGAAGGALGGSPARSRAAAAAEEADRLRVPVEIPKEAPANPPEIIPESFTAPREPVTTFRTAKGSTYQVMEDGTTVRNKAPRPEHPGDHGPQPRSTDTFYVTPEDAVKLGEIQAQGGPTRRLVTDRGFAAMQYMDGPSAGAIERRTVVPIERQPRLGLTPVELWGDKSPHFGNPVVEVEPPAFTAIRKSVDAEERAARGLLPLEADRRAPDVAWGEARRRVEEDPSAARRLIEELDKKPRALTEQEHDVLLQGKMRLVQEHRAALDAEQAALESGDTAALADARARRHAAEAENDAFDRAGALARYEWHATGRAMQQAIREDYTPLALLRKAKIVAADPPAGSAAEKALRQAEPRLVKLSRAIEQADSAARADQEAAVGRAAQRALEREQKAAQRVATRAGRRAAAEDLGIEFDQLRAQFRAKAATPRAGLDPELAAVVYQMARNRVRAGAKTLEQVVSDVHAAVADAADIEPRDIREAIAEGGAPAKPREVPQATRDLQKLRREARLVNILDAAERGEPIPTTGGRPRVLAPPEIVRLRQQVDKLYQERGLGRYSNDARLQQLKARLEKEIPVREQEAATGERVARPARQPVVLDDQALRLQARVRELRLEADRTIRAVELARRPFGQKAMDAAVKGARAVKLTSVGTALLKLPAAAGNRALLWKPIEEVIGGAVTKVLPKALTDKAAIEAGFSARGLAKSYREFFSEATRKDVLAHLKGGEASIDLLHGGTKGALDYDRRLLDPPSWMDYPGHVHAAIKTPPKRAAYMLAMTKQAEAYARQGVEITEPLQALMEARAYEYASRDIFMNDNAVVAAFRRAVSGLEQGGMRKTARAAEVIFPIVKVPTNYAREAIGEYVAGVPRGLVSLARATRAGLENLNPAEANQIVRLFKKGSLGMGLIALGYYGGDKLQGGGFYDPEMEPRRKDVKEGDLRVFGVPVPHILIHHPAIEAIQIGAHLRRTEERFRGRQPERGLKYAGLGVAEEAPFIGETIGAGRKLYSDNGLQGFQGEILRGAVLPPDVQRAARMLDQRPRDQENPALEMLQLQHIEARRRRPEPFRLRDPLSAFWQELEVGIPRLRENVHR